MKGDESPVMWPESESNQRPTMITTITIPTPKRACARFFVREARAKEKIKRRSGRVNCIRKRRSRFPTTEKTGVMQEEKLDMEERHPNDDEEEEEFRKEKLPPNIGLGGPPLAIANESFALDHTKDEEDPRKYEEKRDVTARKGEEER